MKEFEQMEIEYFVSPAQAHEFYQYWVNERYNFYVDKMGISKENLRQREHQKDELAHYAKACTDIEYNFPFGFSELEGIANRGDFDLKEHSRVSKKDLAYFDEEREGKFIPFVIEPSAGVDRTFFAIICDAYNEEEVNGKLRVVLKFKPNLAPYAAAVFPLLKNKEGLVNLAKKIFCDIKDKLPTAYDDTGAIGKLYRRQDEIGTPFCVTVDVESCSDQKVTIRNRDTMKQERISVDKVLEFLKERIGS
jgi:glycyl-tRNA synthetase